VSHHEASAVVDSSRPAGSVARTARRTSSSTWRSGGANLEIDLDLIKSGIVRQLEDPGDRCLALRRVPEERLPAIDLDMDDADDPLARQSERWVAATRHSYAPRVRRVGRTLCSIALWMSYSPEPCPMRFARDSPLEGGVSCEPVSESRKSARSFALFGI
jgi:hypothetical protein